MITKLVLKINHLPKHIKLFQKKVYKNFVGK